MRFDFFLNLLFPKLCLGCGAEGKYVCKECMSHFEVSGRQQCANCGAVTGDGRFCGAKCAGFFNFDQLIVCMDYRKNHLLRKIIKNYKYNFVKELESCLIELMKEAIDGMDFEDFYVVPVPLHPKRMRFRGFNQSLLLAEGVGGGKVNDCLVRRIYRTDQAKLGRRGRMENLKNAFEVKEDIRGRKILLVDDVATTGSTLHECSGALKRAGAVYVSCLVLARVRRFC